MTVSRWHEDLAAHDEAFACLLDLLAPSSFAVTAVRAFREWGQGLLRLSTALVQENAALERENATLRQRINELERSAALDSSTSSKPPASDGPGKKSGTQRRTRSQRQPSPRPSGGQPGHKGTTLARTGSPDHIVNHDPAACSGCGAPLSDTDRHGAPVCRQVFDLPKPRPLEVTEHRAHRCLCGACGTVTKALFPHSVSAPVQYGPRITAWVSYLLHAQFVPEKRLAELMGDLFAVKLSTATIAAMGRRTARRFEDFLNHVAELIRTAAPVKHLDETGIRIAARTRWLHVLCTPLLTVLRIAIGRGHVDEDLNGIVIHDDYATYFTLKGVRHGACNAHHLRELQALIEIEKEDWAKSMHRLLKRAHRLAHFARENDRELPASLVAKISRALGPNPRPSHRLPPNAAAAPDRKARAKKAPHRSQSRAPAPEEQGGVPALPHRPAHPVHEQRGGARSPNGQAATEDIRLLPHPARRLRLRHPACRHSHRSKTTLERPRNPGASRSNATGPATALLKIRRRQSGSPQSVASQCPAKSDLGSYHEPILPGRTGY